MNRRNVSKQLILVLLFSVLIVGIITIQPAKAIIVIDDHFNNGVLDPAWSITFQNATGWTYTLPGTNLTVTDIATPIVNQGSYEIWADVILGQTFTPLTDFHVDFDISWDSEGVYQAMQILFISLYDPNDNLISEVSYFDAFVGSQGTKYASAKIGEEYYSYNYLEPVFEYQAGGNYYFTRSPLDFAGPASIDISRLGSNITISWNGITLVSGDAIDPISKVLVAFMYYPYQGISFFGTQSVDLVKIEGTPIHEPITIDIKPGSDINSINPKSKGKIPVAILSTEGFNAPQMVDWDSLTFGSMGDEVSLAFCNPKGEDINGDRLKDLVCHFYTQDTGFGGQCGDTEGVLRGMTMDGTLFEGRDLVRIVPCKK